jgi:hypothetical protein
MTDFALTGGDDAGTIRSDETGFALGFQDCGDSGHVVLWDSLCDGNDEGNFCCNSLFISLVLEGHASRIASAANGGGTKMAVASAIVNHHYSLQEIRLTLNAASSTVPKTGRLR